MKRYPLSGSQRLKKRREFTSLQERGKRVYSKHFLILIAPAEGTSSRLGITVTTKIDKRAVSRNLIKRRIREVFRIQRERLNGIYDIVIIARQEAGQCTLEEIKREIVGALRYHKYITENKSSHGGRSDKKPAS